MPCVWRKIPLLFKTDKHFFQSADVGMDVEIGGFHPQLVEAIPALGYDTWIALGGGDGVRQALASDGARGRGSEAHDVTNSARLECEQEENLFHVSDRDNDLKFRRNELRTIHGAAVLSYLDIAPPTHVPPELAGHSVMLAGQFTVPTGAALFGTMNVRRAKPL